MNDVGSPIRYVIVRRVGDFDEYLQEDGNFGNLTDHVSPDHVARYRGGVTRVFYDREHAASTKFSLMSKYPTTTEFVSLEIWRLP